MLTPGHLQLAVLFRVVSTRNVCPSLRYPSLLVSHRTQGGLNRSRRHLTPSTRPYGLLSLCLNSTQSFRHRRHSSRILGILTSDTSVFLLVSYSLQLKSPHFTPLELDAVWGLVRALRGLARMFGWLSTLPITGIDPK